MRTLRSLLNGLSTRGLRKRTGAFAALILAGLLFGTIQAHGDGLTEQVYLFSSSGPVNITSYVQVDQYGNTWVVGYDNEPSFEIVLEPNDGQVFDPYGNQIGICSTSD